ncbi:MAG: GNAT family N-acetyltransferase [Chrysiogenales bacterium]
MNKHEQLIFRENVLAGDNSAVRAIVASSGFFYDHEIEVAVELVEERQEKGVKSGYSFLFAEQDEKVVGYCCYGSIACTVGSFDLYWIAVHNDCRGQGIGKILLKKNEELIAAQGGRGIWVETSGQVKYQPTRDFYIHNNYHLEAVLKDFYGPGDDKFIFVKRLT